MPEPHDVTGGARLEKVLQRVSRRLWLLHAAIGVAAALTVAAVLLLVLRLADAPSFVNVAAVATGAVAGYMVFRRASGERTPRAAAAAIEAVHPDCRNVVVTAEELLRAPEGAAAFVRTRVTTAAERVLDGVQVDSVVPRSRFAAPAGFATAGAAAVALLMANPVAVRETYARVTSALGGSASADGLDLSVVITPPQYTGRQAETIPNPEKLEALEGSESISAAPSKLQTGSKPDPRASAIEDAFEKD